MVELCSYELEVLRAFANGTVDDLQQGAALNAAAEALIEGGFMNREGVPSTKGKAALASKGASHE